MVLFFQINRTANVIAKKNCKVLIIKNEGDLLKYFTKSPVFALQCFKEMSQRLLNTTKKLKQNEMDIEYLKLTLEKRGNSQISI